MENKEKREVRVNIRISSETKNFFEELSKEVGAPQSSLMAMALKEYIDQKKNNKNITRINGAIRRNEKTTKGARKKCN